jgi:hypothetical protein
MDVGSADGGLHYFNKNVIDADFRDGNFIQPQAGFRFLLYNRFHCFHHGVFLNSENIFLASLTNLSTFIIPVFRRRSWSYGGQATGMTE